MDLSTTQQILLVILSTFLGIFLIVGIAVGIATVKLLKHVRNIVEKAEQIADRAESVSSFFQQTAGPAAIAKLVSNIIHSVRDSKDKK